ncbi:hypothetical protein [Hymenobacter saemangeumensis]|uniref:tetratricopeptide repeat protein n=1 Tax=Hymenobacter saemangeumensis TaxID=1084522 RepID=UPI0031E97CF4
MPALKTLLWGTLLAALLTAPAAHAQRKPGNSAAPGTGETPPRPARLQPLFGGLPAAEAARLFGPARLEAIAASFASRAEASTFFANKGFEYLSENQPDTATYRFNLAWLLNPQNASAYRGLGVVASAQPTPDAAIALLSQGLALAPADDLLLSDLGTSHLIRYGLSKKKKDLSTGTELLQRATTVAPTNGVAWQQLARAYYYQEKYLQAWEAVHKGRSVDMSSIDFGLIPELQAKYPDPQGMFK